MSLLGIPQTSPDDYDHQILLLDSSNSPSPQPPLNPPEPESASALSRAPSPGTDLQPALTSGSNSRKWTLREELARRKYAKWQEQRFYEDSGLDNDEANGANPQAPAGPKGRNKTAKDGRYASHSRYMSSGRRQGKPPQMTRLGSKSEQEPYEVDILYENQRGSFVCGFPLFSQKSLLNFDPAPWSNASLRDSPVDITNAQPPDPSWVWAWHSWYVDMSADVDEEGWQYSLAFSPSFSWHGTHVWFHSFVRRRRWLRKRVKRSETKGGAAQSTTGEYPTASDYLTIQSGMDQSRRSSTLAGSKAGHSHVSGFSPQESGDESEALEIQDIGTLMAVLKKARIDRERIEAFSAFLSQGGEEVAYLAEEMPEIMSLFIFQASRRRILGQLLTAYHEAAERKSDQTDGATEAHDVSERHAHNLLEAVKAAKEQVKGLEYWSDMKDVAEIIDQEKAAEEGHDTGSHKHAEGSERSQSRQDDNGPDEDTGKRNSPQPRHETNDKEDARTR